MVVAMAFIYIKSFITINERNNKKITTINIIHKNRLLR